MARRPRLDLPGVPQHVIQRGNNRQRCFFEINDYVTYRTFLDLAREKADCLIHAYVMMGNHAHFLVTGNQPGSVSIMMQSLGRRYVRHINKKYDRTGSLWEGRYRSTLVDSENYLLACYRYIELNPVRARIVERPEDYPWSSFKHHVNEYADPLIEDHEIFCSIGKTPRQRARRYRALVRQQIDTPSLRTIRNNTNRGYVLGSARFAERVEAALQRRATPGRPGRPKL
ncbi:MAG: transposase [Xanthomonadales bacterium]|nr:transposase [Xanthomonadales bacterium]